MNCEFVTEASCVIGSNITARGNTAPIGGFLYAPSECSDEVCWNRCCFIVLVQRA